MRLFVRIEEDDKAHFADKAFCWVWASHVDTRCGIHTLPKKYEKNADAVDCGKCISGAIDAVPGIMKQEKEEEVREPIAV